jgi:hypothetical protein
MANKILSLCIVALASCVIVLAIVDFVEVSYGDVSLYPFRSEYAGFFYRSMLHYKFGLFIHIVLSACALVGAVFIWQAKRFSWILILPLFIWLAFPWVVVLIRGYY